MKFKISRQIIMLILIMALSMMSWNILQPMMPIYLTSIKITPELIGLITSVSMVGMVIGESSGGWMADKIGLKTPLILGTFVSGLTILAFLFTYNLAAIFIIFFFWGLFRSAIFGPVRGYIGANSPAVSKATFMAFISVVMSASSSIGALPSGFLADNLGFSSVFIVACGISIVGGVVVLAGLKIARQPKKELIKSSPQTNGSPVALDKSFYRPFIIMCLVALLQFWGWGVSMSFLPLLAHQVIGVSATEVGILFTLSSIAGMLIVVPMGMTADRIGKKTSMVIGLVISMVSAAGIAYSHSYAWLLFFTIIGGFSMAAFTPAALGMVSDSVPASWQGTAMGIYGAFGENVGIITGGAISGFIWSAWGPSYTFLVSSLVSALGIIVCVIFIKNKKPINLPAPLSAKI